MGAFKVCLIEAAEEELKRQGRKVTAVRLSAMTGVHRKDLREHSVSGVPAPVLEHPVVRLMGRWQHHEDYIDPVSGGPRGLTIGGERSEFTDLVKEVGGDLNQYALLFELERMSAIERRDDKVFLVASAALDNERGSELVAEGLDDLVESIRHNQEVAAPEERNLHLVTSFDRIPEVFAAELRSWIRAEGSRFQEKVASQLARYDLDTAPRSIVEGNLSAPVVTVSVASFAVVKSRDNNLLEGRREKIGETE